MRKTLTFEIKVMASVEVDYQKGSKDRFDSGFGNWLPGDPASVKILSVNLYQGLESIEVTKFLSDVERDEIQTQAEEELHENDS